MSVISFTLHRNRRFSVSCGAIAQRAGTADLAFKGYQAKEPIISLAAESQESSRAGSEVTLRHLPEQILPRGSRCPISQLPSQQFAIDVGSGIGRLARNLPSVLRTSGFGLTRFGRHSLPQIEP